jgi:hypothetical protein
MLLANPSPTPLPCTAAASDGVLLALQRLLPTGPPGRGMQSWCVGETSDAVGRPTYASGRGERWLGEAESFLFEAAPTSRAKVTRNYLLTAPR